MALVVALLLNTLPLFCARAHCSTLCTYTCCPRFSDNVEINNLHDLPPRRKRRPPWDIQER